MPLKQKIHKLPSALFLLFFTTFFVFPEKWVGQAATYQLIEGSKTATGESFDKEGFFAACNGFKLGSKVAVVNSKTGKSVVVTINDRLNPDSKYFILLTPKASKELEFEWDTGLVVVNGNFSDINSTERIAINGLVREGEIDLETIKQFPEIKWPEEKQTTNNNAEEKQEDMARPKIREQEVPSKKNEVAVLDEDEKNGYIDVKEKKPLETKETPAEEKYLTPESKMREYMMSKDIDDKPLPKKDQEFAMVPQEKEKTTLMDADKEDAATQKEDTKNVLLPVEEEKYAMIPQEKQNIIDKDEEMEDVNGVQKEIFVKKKEDAKFVKTPETEKTESKKEQKEILWRKALEPGKTYIRFFTSLNKVECEKKFQMYQELFPCLVGIVENGKYILFAGPFSSNNFDLNLRNIRSYGFRDAYIMTAK